MTDVPEYTYTIHEVFSVTATASPGSYSVDVDMTYPDGSRIRALFASGSNDPYGAGPDIRHWLQEHGGEYEVIPYTPPGPVFEPIEPAPFWRAAKDLFGLKKSDVLNAIEDEDERYDAELSIMDRKTYHRDDETVIKLMTLLGYVPEQMDTTWLYVQENYK